MRPVPDTRVMRAATPARARACKRPRSAPAAAHAPPQTRWRSVAPQPLGSSDCPTSATGCHSSANPRQRLHSIHGGAAASVGHSPASSARQQPPEARSHLHPVVLQRLGPPIHAMQHSAVSLGSSSSHSQPPPTAAEAAITATTTAQSRLRKKNRARAPDYPLTKIRTAPDAAQPLLVRVLRRQKYTALKIAKRRADRYATGLRLLPSKPNEQCLDLGRDEFRKLMRDDGLRNHEFCTLITREDLVHGGNLSDSDEGQSYFDDEDFHSECTYEPSIVDDEGPLDQRHPQSFTESTMYESHSKSENNVNSISKCMSVDMEDISFEIETALTSMGIASAEGGIQ
ncbi:hypothetical protein HDU84_005019 [Entophlyctis sp. JEL0112]|nr:hypothetical protein HDU84_005019 [Entophlyctis sp. JEL0112]